MLKNNIISKHSKPSIVAYGNHNAILQSILDFDYLCGKNSPSVVAIISSTGKYDRYFWGEKEVLIPIYKSIDTLPLLLTKQINGFINFSSGKRLFQTSTQLIQLLPKLKMGTLLAEGMSEKDSLDLAKIALKKSIILFGPSSVGLLIPGLIKLGPIGGTHYQQLIDSKLSIRGKVAVLSASGGMTNELIHVLCNSNQSISMALSFGGDRFPIATPKEMILCAQADPHTEHIVYYGEIGGTDEYEIAELIKSKKVTKPVIAYIAGSVAELFEKPFQFGHAKAIAQSKSETVQEKRNALIDAGAKVAQTFGGYIELLTKIPQSSLKNTHKSSLLDTRKIEYRSKSLFTSTISKDDADGVILLGSDIASYVQKGTIAYIVASLFLGKNKVSKEFEQFVDIVIKVLVDHGPLVSGALNSIITARAGKDLVSSLVAGLLTIGPRFGGVINDSASNWFNAVQNNIDPYDFVETYAVNHTPIPGIGHKRYNLYDPDPRIVLLLKYTQTLKKREYYNFGRRVEEVTTAKKSNLILNIDGTIGAIMLDILAEKDKLSVACIRDLLDAEFFNAFFILARTVGFIAHSLDQKRLDEGLFRLPNELNNYIEI